MSRKQAASGVGAVGQFSTRQFSVRSRAELQLGVRAPVSPTLFLTQGRCPPLKAWVV